MVDCIFVMCVSAKSIEQATILPPTIPLHSFTPLKPLQFALLLENHPDKYAVSHFCTGLTNGFSLGYFGPQEARFTKNAQTAFQHPDIVAKYIKKEIESKHTSGPFSSPPFPDFVVSSLGVRPKKTGGARLIMDLSRPFGNSVNDYISKEAFTMRFSNIDEAVALVTLSGVGSFMAKMDVKSAFRLIPVRKQDWNLLGYCHDNRYYFDTVLPFGLRSSPAISNRLSEFMKWMIITKSPTCNWVHYMDDFFVVCSTEKQCQASMKFMANLCTDLGVPLAEDKTEGPLRVITFLGVGINSSKQTLFVPEGKFQEILVEFSLFDRRQRATKRQLLSLVGKLTAITKCIPAGRIFLRRILNLAHRVKRLDHTVHLNQDFKADLEWWKQFLPLWNGFASFLEPAWTTADKLLLFTDASASIGCGAIQGVKWFNCIPLMPYILVYDIQESTRKKH